MSSGTSEQPAELQQKAVVSKVRDGLGWDVELECGHKVWFACEPGSKSFCGECLDAFVQRAKRAGQVGE